MQRRMKVLVMVLGLAAVLLVTGGVALAGHGIPADNSTEPIHGCYENQNPQETKGALRVVSDPSKCNPNNETLIEWLGAADDDWTGAGTGQMYATFPSDNVGIGTTTPQSRLHIDESLSTTFDAVKVTFDNNPGFQTSGTGIKIDGAPLTVKGASIGVWSDTSKTAGPDLQRGSARSFLSIASGFFLGGQFEGIRGISEPNELANFDNNSQSTGLGGFFLAKPDGTLALDDTGTYWVGGVYGEVDGAIDHTPASGVVAGIIGVDNADGSAKSYAGYFKGDVRATEYVQLALTFGPPPAADCDEPSEMGRMKVDDSGGGFLYVCTATPPGIGWVAK